MLTMSRRKALRLTAATTAASLTAASAALAAGIAEADPIYAAIERHRVANAGRAGGHPSEGRCPRAL
jgi:hypothetical protein